MASAVLTDAMHKLIRLPSSPQPAPRTVHITVDERCPVTFALPASEVAACNFPASSYLPKVTVTDFHDFAKYLQTGKVLQYPHNDVEYAIEQHARQLVNAIKLGIGFNHGGYTRAAEREFLALGKLLPWPEDYVNGVFEATKGLGVPHSARKLIVAIVAAKTCGRGKRGVRQGPRDRNVSCLIESHKAFIFTHVLGLTSDIRSIAAIGLLATAFGRCLMRIARSTVGSVNTQPACLSRESLL